MLRLTCSSLRTHVCQRSVTPSRPRACGQLSSNRPHAQHMPSTTRCASSTAQKRVPQGFPFVECHVIVSRAQLSTTKEHTAFIGHTPSQPFSHTPVTTTQPHPSLNATHWWYLHSHSHTHGREIHGKLAQPHTTRSHAVALWTAHWVQGDT